MENGEWRMKNEEWRKRSGDEIIAALFHKQLVACN